MFIWNFYRKKHRHIIIWTFSVKLVRGLWGNKIFWPPNGPLICISIAEDTLNQGLCRRRIPVKFMDYMDPSGRSVELSQYVHWKRYTLCTLTSYPSYMKDILLISLIYILINWLCWLSYQEKFFMIKTVSHFLYFLFHILMETGLHIHLVVDLLE